MSENDRLEKVLIICNHFAPDNTIAAVRTSKLAKYLRVNGYQVEVIAEKKDNTIRDDILERETKGIKVSYACNSSFIRWFLNCYQRLIKPIKQNKFEDLSNRKKVNPKTGNIEFYTFQRAYPLLGSLDYLIELLRQYDLFVSIKRLLKNYENVSYVFTSYGDAFTIYAGKYFNKNHKNIPWILDMRDAICRYEFTPKYVKCIARWQEKNVWRNADSITAVSKGICRMVPRKYWDKLHCVTNGYDWSDREGLSRERIGADKLIFTYTGSMYGGLQNLTMFFSCMKDLLDEGKVNRERIAFYFAGNQPAYEVFMSQAKEYGLEKYCIYYGKVNRRESLQLQSQSDLLLVSSFDYQMKEGGVLTGKALEYMSANRPIIALNTGDIECSELGTVIREANLGIIYEEIHKEPDYKKLKDYINRKYQEFLNDGIVSHEPSQKVLRKYDYRNISRRLIKIMENM